MRKNIFVLVVLFLGVNAYAGLIFMPEIEADGSAIVTWTSDLGVAGMALECIVTSGGEGLTVKLNDFNVYIDDIHDGTEYPGSNPIANPDGPGTTVPVGRFVICGGYLVENNPGLFTGTIEFDAEEYTTIDIFANEIRGGVVAIGGTELPFTPFEVIVLPEPTAMALLGVGGLAAIRKQRIKSC